MKSRPILFSAPMVRALLDGSKTQTRRVVKKLEVRDGTPEPEFESLLRCCPHGQVGDQLWVKESWKIANWSEDGEIDIFYTSQPSSYLHWIDIVDLKDAKGESVFERLWQQSTDDCLKAGLETLATGKFNFAGKVPPTRNRPSIFMLRAASRITLEITNVRVERLQDISEADATAEGTPHSLNHPAGRTAIENYEHLWECLNGDDSWDLNPWVWVIEFKKVKP